jgi:phage shock protein C
MFGPNVFSRDDTMFGVCQALAEDFGFNPFLLRILLAVALLWSPLATIGVYAASGAVVALSRWMIQEPRQPLMADESDDQSWSFEEMALAA